MFVFPTNNAVIEIVSPILYHRLVISPILKLAFAQFTTSTITVTAIGDASSHRFTRKVSARKVSEPEACWRNQELLSPVSASYVPIGKCRRSIDRASHSSTRCGVWPVYPTLEDGLHGPFGSHQRSIRFFCGDAINETLVEMIHNRPSDNQDSDGWKPKWIQIPVLGEMLTCPHQALSKRLRSWRQRFGSRPRRQAFAPATAMNQGAEPDLVASFWDKSWADVVKQ